MPWHCSRSVLYAWHCNRKSRHFAVSSVMSYVLPCKAVYGTMLLTDTDALLFKWRQRKSRWTFLLIRLPTPLPSLRGTGDAHAHCCAHTPTDPRSAASRFPRHQTKGHPTAVKVCHWVNTELRLSSQSYITNNTCHLKRKLPKVYGYLLSNPYLR
jgi:hypothetical protein